MSSQLEFEMLCVGFLVDLWSDFKVNEIID